MNIFDISNRGLTKINSLDKIVGFYVEKGYGDKKFIESYLQKTDCIFVEMKDGSIAGILRSLSDHARFAFIVDLFVGKEFRKQRIGTRLLKAAGDYYQNINVRNIELSTDPKDPGLPEFYKKVGFVQDLESKIFTYPSKN